MNFKGKGPGHRWWWQSGSLAEHEGLTTIFGDIVGDNWLALRPGCELLPHPQLSVCSSPCPTLGMPGRKTCPQCFTWEVDGGQRVHRWERQAVHRGFPYHLLLFSRGSPEQPKGYISELFCWGGKPLAVPLFPRVTPWSLTPPCF